jgi:hypothetical protein
MSLLKDKWVWISAAIGLILAVVVSGLYVGAYAAPAPVVGTVAIADVPGDYREPTTVNWSFTGKEGQYPRLHLLFVCWQGTPDGTGYNAQGTPNGVDLVTADFVFLTGQYPGSGTVTFDFTGWSLRWDSYPGDATCHVALLDWQTKSYHNQDLPRLHAVTPDWVANDPRVP